MKKTVFLFVILYVSLVSAVRAEYTETELKTSINMLFNWQEENSTVRNYPGSVAADFYIMSLAHMDSEYNFKSYIKLTENINPPTKQDGQRLIMSNAACNEKLSDSFAGWYTYKSKHDNASELAGAITALDSGGYAIKGSDTDINNMVCDLLAMQQQNGSFSNDILTTAKAIIALSPRADAQFRFKGTNTGEEYGYNCKEAIHNAVLFLSASQKDDGGYMSVINTAYVIIALNSININPDNDAMFTKNNLTPINYIISNIDSSGSVFSLADDTALSSAALISQLNYKQNKPAFFDFSKIYLKEQTTTKPELIIKTETETPTQSTTSTPLPVIEVTPPPTKVPEHSAVTEEQYGPLPFVGPIQIEKKKNKETPTEFVEDEIYENDETGINIVGLVISIIAALLSVAGFIFLTILKIKPQSFEKSRLKLKYIFDKKENRPYVSDDSINNINDDSTLKRDFYKTPEVVSKEELYDPDFVKKLIPVDELDSSIESILDDNS